MAIQTITYDNKVALNTNPDIADINKCNASDMNEIKSVVNNNANEFNNYQKNEVVLWENSNTTVNFAAQTVTLSEPIENFRYYTAFFRHATDNTFLVSGISKPGYGMRVHTDGWAIMNHRDITSISGTSCTFSDNKEFPTYGGNERAANHRLIPFQIIGEY